MKKPLFNVLERFIINDYLNNKKWYEDRNSMPIIVLQYHSSKLKQEVFKKLIVPICNPIIKFLSKILS